MVTTKLRTTVAQSSSENSRRYDGSTTVYSWVNPKLRNKARVGQSPNTTDAASTSQGGGYKQIEFDGCGTILLNSGASSITSKQHTGLSLWSAAYVLSYYCDALWSQEESRNNNEPTTLTILELGAGLGLCSAVAAKHGMNVISTDSDSQALTLLEENLRRNHVTCNEKSGEVSVHTLDWVAASRQSDIAANPVFVQLEKYGGADLIILSDVIYSATKPAWKALIKLLGMLRALRRNLVKNSKDVADTPPAADPLILLGYTQRRRDMSPQEESEFFTLLQEAGMEAVMVPPDQIPHGEKYMLTVIFELRWSD